MNIWFEFLLVFIVLVFFIKMAYVVSTALVLKTTRGALFVTTPAARIETCLKYVDINSDASVVDLGCGHGGVLRKISKKCDVNALVGYEINPFACVLAKLFCFRDKKIHIKRRNFFQERLSDFDIIFCYLFPDVMEALTEKLRTEAKPGAVLVSFNFCLKGVNADSVLKPEQTRHNEPIFVYYF